MAEYPWSTEDNDSLARLWERLAEPWTMQALGRRLGVTTAAISLWCSGKRRGPWPALRGAMRATARRHPHLVAPLVEALAEELLDARGHWVPENTTGEDLDWSSESDDVDIARGRLAESLRNPIAPPTVIERNAEDFEREAREAALAARQLAARRRRGAA